jgi:hypothetical protein
MPLLCATANQPSLEQQERSLEIAPEPARQSQVPCPTGRRQCRILGQPDRDLLNRYARQSATRGDVVHQRGVGLDLDR